MHQLYYKLLRKLQNNKKIRRNHMALWQDLVFRIVADRRQQTTTDEQTADELDARERF